MITPDPIITAIAAVLQKDYGVGPDSARSIVRRVLELSASESPTGWSHDEHCPPEDLRGPCSNNCAACYDAATEAIRRGLHEEKRP